MFALLIETPGLFVAATFSVLGAGAFVGFSLARLQYLKHFNSVVDEAVKYVNAFGERTAEQGRVVEELTRETVFLRDERDFLFKALAFRGSRFEVLFQSMAKKIRVLTNANRTMAKQLESAKAAAEAAENRVRELEGQVGNSGNEVRQESEVKQGNEVKQGEEDSPYSLANEVALLKETIRLLELGREEDKSTNSRLREQIKNKDALIAEKNEQLVSERRAAKRGVVAAVPEEVAEAAKTEAISSSSLRDAKTHVLWKICGEEVLVPLPQRLSEIRPWAEKWLGDKVVFAPGALKGIETFEAYQRPERVYIGMLLLLTKQEMMTVPEGDEEKRNALRDEYNRCLDELGLRDTATAGAGVRKLATRIDGDFVQFNRAIKSKSSYQPLRDLRIYYAVDNARKRVIVGSAPRHL